MLATYIDTALEIVTVEEQRTALPDVFPTGFAYSSGRQA